MGQAVEEFRIIQKFTFLKALCEIHFDENPRFKVHYTDEYVKTDNIEAIRLQPAGFEMSGKAIWYQQVCIVGNRDKFCNTILVESKNRPCI